MTSLLPLAVALLALPLAAHSQGPMAPSWSFAQSTAMTRAQIASQAAQVTGGSKAWQPADGQLNTWWAEFKQQFGKSYPTPQAETAAKAAFKANVAQIYINNADASKGTVMGANAFSDLDFAAFQAQRLMKTTPQPASKPNTSGRKLLANGDEIFHDGTWAPEQEQAVLANHGRRLQQSSVDWRASGKVTAIRNQAQCGSCWAFAATAAIESAYLIGVSGVSSNVSTLNLSEQQLVSCASNAAGYASYGCDGGWSDWAMYYVVQKNQTTEAKYPYTSSAGVTGSCNIAAVNTQPGQVVSQNGIGYVTANDAAALRAAVARQPTIIYFQVVNDFQSYRGGLYTTSACTGATNHAMLAVGYVYTGNANTDYWIVKNSWDTWWGASGYVNIQMATAQACGMYKAQPMYPTLTFKATLSTAPSPPSPPPAPSPRPPPPAPPPPSPPPATPCTVYVSLTLGTQAPALNSSACSRFASQVHTTLNGLSSTTVSWACTVQTNNMVVVSKSFASDAAGSAFVSTFRYGTTAARTVVSTWLNMYNYYSTKTSARGCGHSLQAWGSCASTAAFDGKDNYWWSDYIFLC